MRYLLATGMFRSGTTLLGKILNAHPEISFASDPYRPFFNDWRDVLAETHGLLSHNPPHAPLPSYFCNDEESRLMKIVQDSNLNDLGISPERLKRLVGFIQADKSEQGLSYSPFITEHLNELQGKTYKELYDRMMSLIQKYYGKKDEKLVGMKEVWCTEFARPLLRTFPNMKLILIVRDPRAVFASNHNKNERSKYPWLFLIRQWRKLAAFTRLLSSSPEYKNSVLELRYEDLVSDPEVSARKICSFLEINYAGEMIDGSKFRDGFGNPWRQNSSHGTGEQIAKTFTETWRQALREDEIRLIELLCQAEMELFGYELTRDDVKRITLNDVFNPRIVPYAELAEWIQKYSSCDLIENVSDMMKEFFRQQLLLLSDDELARVDDKIIESMYISKKHFENIKANYKHLDAALK